MNQSLLRLGLRLAKSLQQLSPAEQERLRKELYEQATGKPYQPEQSVGRRVPKEDK